MKDSFDRTIDYLRISLTDRCNLRCAYCVPKEGVSLCTHGELLTLEEVWRLVNIFAGLGIRKIKYTGGEVLLRKNFPYLLKKTIETAGIKDVGITTNGMLLEEKIPELLSAGLKRVNVSLDTFSADSYEKLTGSRNLTGVLRGIDKACSAGLKVKINCVPIDGYFDQNDMTSIALLSKDRNIDVRFIELMPIGSAKDYRFKYSSEQLLSELEKHFGKSVPVADVPDPEMTEKKFEKAFYHTPDLTRSFNETTGEIGQTKERQFDIFGKEEKTGTADRTNSFQETTGEIGKTREQQFDILGEKSMGSEATVPSVAEYYTFPGFQGKTGFISPRSRIFCSECRRIRLDCRGFLRLCLSHPDGVDLRSPLREGATDEELSAIIEKAVLGKPKEHCFSGGTVSDSMCSIGG